MKLTLSTTIRLPHTDIDQEVTRPIAGPKPLIAVLPVNAIIFTFICFLRERSKDSTSVGLESILLTVLARLHRRRKCY